MNPFPLNVTGTTLSATTSSSSARMPDGGSTLVVKNSGTVPVFVATAVGSATATTSSQAVLAGGSEPFTIPENHTHVAAITSSGTATVYVYRGYGK